MVSNYDLYAQSLSHVQLFVTPWTAARQAPLSMDFHSKEYYNGLPFPSPGDHAKPEIEHSYLVSPALPVGFFSTSTTWEAPK